MNDELFRLIDALEDAAVANAKVDAGTREWDILVYARSAVFEAISQPVQPATNKAIFDERHAFYIEQIKDRKNHSALAFDLAYCRAIKPPIGAQE